MVGGWGDRAWSNAKEDWRRLLVECPVYSTHLKSRSWAGQTCILENLYCSNKLSLNPQYFIPITPLLFLRLNLQDSSLPLAGHLHEYLL